MKLIECVPNISEGRDQHVINEIGNVEVLCYSSIGGGAGKVFGGGGNESVVAAAVPTYHGGFAVLHHIIILLAPA